MTSETDYDFNDHFKDYGKLPPLDAIEEIIDRPRVVESGSTAKQLRYRLIPFRELKPATVSPYLIKGLIPRTGLVVVWGPPKCGKSFWTFDLSMHVALGWEYRGRRTSTGPVVYCAFEGGDGFKGRVEAFRREHSVTEAEFYLVPSVMNLIADHQQLIASIRGQTANPSAVVLDTLNRSLVGSESNDEDMAKYMKAADAIREAFGCVVIIVHHCGIDGTRPRGHTSLTGAADAQLAVRRDGQDNIVVTVEFMKDGPEGAIIASNLRRVELGFDEDGDPITSCVIVPNDDAVPTRPKQKLAAIPSAALKELIELAAAGVDPHPPSEHIPIGVTTVTFNRWRERLNVTRTINPEGNPREQFRRIYVTLKNVGAIGIWEDFVWPVT